MRRFWANVDRAGPMMSPYLGPCWTWTGSLRKGYGQFYLGGRRPSAHIVAYELVCGPIPHGLELDHLCRNPACVNPAHLEAVTHAENMLRGSTIAARNAAKTHCRRGHPYDEANTYRRGDGERRCRTCKRTQDRARHHAKGNR